MSELPFRLLHRIPGVQPVVPQRFVWHVCRSTEDERASIERFGLLAGFSQYDCVFANNQSVDLESFFPFVLYGVCEAYTYYGAPYSAPDHDIWRIDTSLCDAQWFIDPNMINEYRTGPRSWYICTRENIPPAALRRYRVLPTWEERFLVQQRPGVASFVGPRMQLAPFPFAEEDLLPIVERAA